MRQVGVLAAALVLVPLAAHAQQPPGVEGAGPPPSFESSSRTPRRDMPRPADGDWPWQPPRATSLFSLAAGPGYHNLLGSSIGGGELALSLGQDRRRLSWSVGATGGLGSTTDSGLLTSQLALEVGVLATLQRVRLGGGPRIGWMTVERVTTDARFQLLSIGLVGAVSFDLVSDGERTFAIGLYPSWEAVLPPKIFDLDGGSAGLYGVTARLAVRWRGGA